MPPFNCEHIIQKDEETPLSPCFEPGPTHVVCMRGNLFWDHKGNQMYRNVIKDTIPRYSRATSRVEKSRMVSEVIDAIQGGNPPCTGGFVKRTTTGWAMASNDMIREKIGQSLRDGLHGRYKSSTKAKKRRNKELKAQMNASLDTLVASRCYVNTCMDNASKRIKTEQPSSDDHFHNIFLQANSVLLQSIKMDQTIASEYKALCS
mmetsp:Transcript_22187/g.62967  ORF Transcript_22187/g.62967 Transcript_22187/m.62967 type:complete len:205 (+) Transcript_22187:176-790(+)|eukprot:CAMPEP_0119550272 /NCGR_PEP_ID=MMETSP1352-20130426/3807_1 /TAXON_ID=265584 /ORGANISM="Stauroneis constricta, Strain CCMP1120" /LENGTH=204 /DNA_ID=CAMNT_0007596057 /DNA_START=140 /DNA_END=754 /DNA_ORIENTATION=+